MKLTVSERLSIEQFLPREGTMLEQITARDTLQKTKILPGEREKIKWYQSPKGLEIAEESDFEVDFEFDKSEIEMLKEGFRKLEESKKINQQNISLALKLRDLK